jgi:superfamily II DNA or RNA helicase
MIVQANRNFFSFTFRHLEKMVDNIITKTFKLVQKDLNLEFELKPEQIKCLGALYEKKDTMGLLPTGFGKSIIFVLMPLSILKFYLSMFAGRSYRLHVLVY